MAPSVAELRVLQLKVDERDAQLRSEQLKRSVLEARLASVVENNKALAKQNTLLLKQTDRLRLEAELLQHQLASCSAAYKAREAGSTHSVSLLQQRVEELGVQLHAKEAEVVVLQRKLVQHQAAQIQPAQQPDFEGSEGSVTGGWAVAAAQAACPQDSFLVCADSANSTPEVHRTAQPVQSANCDASAAQEQCWPADSFLVCADSANSASMQDAAAAGNEGDVTSRPQLWQPQELEEEDSFVVLADSPLSSSLGWCEQQEQLPPQPHLSLPKTVRLLAHKGSISLPLQPAGAPVQQPCKQPLNEQPIPSGSAGDSPPASVAESQGSNQPDTTPADSGMGSGMGVSELRRSCDSSTGDRESAASALPTILSPEQCSGEDVLELETASHPESCTSELRSSGRMRRRVSYALPNLKSKLRQGDSFTFGDPAAVPKLKSRTRTKPKPRFKQPAPGAAVDIPGIVAEEAA